MKAMWSAASGMRGLQMKIDTISNNLANVNTVGFKKQRLEFKDMMYERLTGHHFLEDEGYPVGLEVGHGVLPAATTRTFTNGSFERTGNQLDFAANGEGFFVVENPRGEAFYTRDGSFKISVSEEGSYLTTSDGYYVQAEGGRVNLGQNIKDINVDQDGNITVVRMGEEVPEKIDKLLFKKFINPAGLEGVGRNFYQETLVSGEAMDVAGNGKGEIWQGHLEMSNVEVVDEMINLITAQRAYEVNSKTIQTVDRMLEVAGNLKR